MASLSRDVQINPLGTEDAPADFVLPAAMEIVPKSVFALFDGAAAGSSFLPTLEIVSDSGHTVARVPVSSPVAAGGSAAVSWFPGSVVGSQGTVFDQAGMWQLSTDPAQPITAGSTFDLQFIRGNWLIGGFFDLDVGNGILNLQELNAIYFLSVSVLWEAADFPRAVFFRVPTGTGGGFLPQFTDRHDYQPAGAFTLDDPTGLGSQWARDTAVIHPSSNGTPPIAVTVSVQNGDVVDRNITAAYLAAYAVGLGGGPPV